MGQGAAPGTLENPLKMKWSEGMSQTQHAGLAFREVDDVGRDRTKDRTDERDSRRN